MKPSLAQLAAHLELLARGQEIVVRLSPELAPKQNVDDQTASLEMTLAAARVLRSLAPFEDDLRGWLRGRIVEMKGLHK